LFSFASQRTFEPPTALTPHHHTHTHTRNASQKKDAAPHEGEFAMPPPLGANKPAQGAAEQQRQQRDVRPQADVAGEGDAGAAASSFAALKESVVREFARRTARSVRRAHTLLCCALCFFFVSARVRALVCLATSAHPISPDQKRSRALLSLPLPPSNPADADAGQ
jgi:hypothetical protein